MAVIYYTKQMNRDVFLNEALCVHYSFVPIIYKDEKGKPYLENIEDTISISHSGEYIVLAISKNGIGVDIQKKDYREAVVRLFSKYEQVDDALLFTRLWTMKESYGKYLGIGLNKEIISKDFSKFMYDEWFELDDMHFYVKEIDDYVCAICTNDDTIQYVCLGG